MVRLSVYVDQLTVGYAGVSFVTQWREYSAEVFLHKPLESVYLSAGTHPYQQPCSNAPPAEDCQREKEKRGGGEKEDEALWKALICT